MLEPHPPAFPAPFLPETDIPLNSEYTLNPVRNPTIFWNIPKLRGLGGTILWTHARTVRTSTFQCIQRQRGRKFPLGFRVAIASMPAWSRTISTSMFLQHDAVARASIFSCDKNPHVASASSGQGTIPARYRCASFQCAPGPHTSTPCVASLTC